ncbi:hypothetical protein CSUI_003491 [Cystoisospora suis]|uniref:Transmembrane protein n=1 Tax=Cystoisospora suis TaxID=483139 RepID=A0A2C6L5B3_9APIC|nr:hypothetical protein CSUI_003491 [Cystoisospora suis]
MPRAAAWSLGGGRLLALALLLGTATTLALIQSYSAVAAPPASRVLMVEASSLGTAKKTLEHTDTATDLDSAAGEEEDGQGEQEQDEDDDEPSTVDLWLPRKRRPASSRSRSKKVQPRTDDSAVARLLRNPARLALFSMTVMLVGSSIGAGTMYLLAQKQQKQNLEKLKKMEEYVGTHPRLQIDPRAATEAGVSAALLSVASVAGTTLLSNLVITGMQALRANFFYTAVADSIVRTLATSLGPGFSLTSVLLNAVVAAGTTAVTQTFGLLGMVAIPLMLFGIQMAAKMFGKVETKDRQALAFMFVENMQLLKRALKNEKTGEAKKRSEIVTKHFNLMEKELMHLKLLDGGSKSALDTAESSLKSSVEKGKDIDRSVESTQKNFLRQVGAKAVQSSLP